MVNGVCAIAQTVRREKVINRNIFFMIYFLRVVIYYLRVVIAFTYNLILNSPVAVLYTLPLGNNAVAADASSACIGKFVNEFEINTHAVVVRSY